MTPTTLPLQRYLEALHEKYRALDEGTVTTYIPELAKADPDWFGVCMVTTDGSHAGGRVFRGCDDHLRRRTTGRSRVFHSRRRGQRRIGTGRRLAPAPCHAFRWHELRRDGDARQGRAQRTCSCRYTGAQLDLERPGARRARCRRSRDQDRVLRNLSLGLAQKLRQANQLIGVLAA